MNWEESKLLTPLKRDALRFFFEKTQQFYLTGGSALGIFYLQHRYSYDLDFFSTDPVDWHQVIAMVNDGARSMGAECRGLVSAPYFHRFELTRGEDREILDFVHEVVSQIDPDKPRIGAIRIDTMREIGVNKLCTLVGRCEAKDVVDLYFLDQAGFDIVGNIAAAQRKDGGVDPATISFVLSTMKIGDVPGFLVRPVTREEIRDFINRLRLRLADAAFPASDKAGCSSP
jgi:hypothetical protein